MHNLDVKPSRDLENVRVAFLTNSLSPHSLPLWECVSRYVGRFCAFVSSGFDTQHNFPTVRTHLEIRVQRSINRFRFYHKKHGRWESDDFHMPFDTYQQLTAYQPDLVISGQFGLRTTLSVLYRLRHPHVKLILWATLSCRSEQYRGRLRLFLRRWILNHIDAAFVNGKSGEEYLRQLGYRGRLTYIPYSIDGSPFSIASFHPQPKKMRLLFTGRLAAQKGLRCFCTVLNQWCADHPDITIRFRCVGEGPDEQFLRTMITHENLTIEVFPKVSQSGLRSHYEDSDIFVLPSRSDEWAVVTNEAMNAGLPVLGSIQAQSVLELVHEGVTGWQFDLLDEQSTYAGFDRAFHTPVEQLHAMSIKAKQVVEEFSPERISLRVIAMIKTLHLESEGRTALPVHRIGEVKTDAAIAQAEGLSS